MMGANSKDMDAADDEKPAHLVTLTESYYIGKFPVTQSQWKKIMGNNPSNFEDCPNCPIESVNWNDCQEFIKKLNSRTGRTYRLPTEAEWEFAARGGNKSRGYKYAGGNNLDELGWHSENSQKIKKVEKKSFWGFVKTEDVSEHCTHDVSLKKANELGIYDMSGNVWEWCQDWYGDYDASSKTNPKGASSGSSRVLRGGSWDDGPLNCRVSYRNFNGLGRRNLHDGFRLVLTP